MKSEQVVRRQYEERVTEVEQALKDAASKCESLEEKNNAQATDLAKALQEAEEVGEIPSGVRGDLARETDSGW